MRKLSTGKKLRHLLRTALGVRLSTWWRGYGQGLHREEELLVEGDQPAKPRGRKKGWEPKLPRYRIATKSKPRKSRVRCQ